MSLAAVLFDASCVSCGGAIDTRVDARAVLCRRCVRTLSPPTRIRTPDGLEECRVLCDYDGVGRDLVVALKFRGRHAAVPWLADRLAELAGDMGVQVVTWAPTSRSRRRSRGFDQAELLARRVARRLIVPWRRCLVRLPGPAQTGRDRAARLAGPRFDARRGVGRAVAGRRVLVVDDVITTGATMTAAADVLGPAGASAVLGVAIAHTPDR